MNTRRSSEIALILAAFAAAGCQAAEESQPFQVVTAQLRNLAIQAEAAGVIEPVTKVDLKSKASGEILSVPVEIGDAVEKGQLVLQVEQTEARQELAQAQADLDVANARLRVAESQLQRALKLRESDIIADQEFEQAQLEHATAKAQLVRAQASLEVARERLADTTIRAPISGTIIDKSIEAGQVISSATREVGGGTLLMTMADLGEVQVRTLVDETDIGKVRPDLQAEVIVEAYRERTFRGLVLKIEPQATVQQNVTTFPVIIRIDNRDRLLKPGMSAQVIIQVARRNQAVTVPNQALHPPQDARTVAELALGIGEDEFEALLAASRPAALASNGPGGDRAGAGSDGDGQPRPQSKIDSLVARLRSGEMSREDLGGLIRRGELSREDMTQLRERFGRGGGGGPEARGSGGPSRGVVFVVRDGRPVPVRVRTGLTDWENIEILSGLEEGDSVALLPTAALLRDQAQRLQRFQRFRQGVPGMRRQGN